MVADKEQELMDELAATKGELEILRQGKENLTRELKERDAKIASIEQALASRENELAALKQAMAEAEVKLNDINVALAQAVASYKTLAVEANPGVLAELITGDTVDEVNKSLGNARILINKVKQEVEAEASKTKIPAGAPQRAPLDLSGLSPREKIQYAIGGKR